MTTALPSVMIGVFRDRALMEQAIDELRETGWMTKDVHVIGEGSGGVLGALKSAFAVRAPAEELGPDALEQIDIPTEQRDLYRQELEQGSTVLLVYPQGHLLETRDILNQHGAVNVFTPFQLGEEQRVVHLRQEVPHIEKYVMDVGEIRIHKRVIIEQKTFTIPVRREEVTVERISIQSPSQQIPPAQGVYAGPPKLPAQPGYSVPPQNPDQAGYPPLNLVSGAEAFSDDEVLRDEGILRIRVRAEEVLFQKQPVVVEEIVIQKQMVQETRQLVEPIKHEEARIEKIGDVRVYEANAVEAPEKAGVVDTQQ